MALSSQEILDLDGDLLLQAGNYPSDTLNIILSTPMDQDPGTGTASLTNMPTCADLVATTNGGQGIIESIQVSGPVRGHTLSFSPEALPQKCS